MRSKEDTKMLLVTAYVVYFNEKMYLLMLYLLMKKIFCKKNNITATSKTHLCIYVNLNNIFYRIWGDL